jgi:SAM-dependent methyltransferase
LAEFTGERAIPGQIEPDLWNEHLARYVFASRRAQGRRVLDAGCGTGYGAALLAGQANWVCGVDVSGEAIEFARSHYRRDNLSFLRATVTALPFPEASFDVIVAFEVIEHLADWRGLLAELRRVVTPEGECLISTPNRLYYAEARGESGPNPYHHREFDWQELRAELADSFPFVSLYVENHQAAITIVPVEAGPPVEGAMEQAQPDPAEAHFLLAVCRLQPGPLPPALIWTPRAANLLRERERHIAALQEELAQKDAWLEEARREKQELLEMYRSQTAELERSNRWAASLDRGAGGGAGAHRRPAAGAGRATGSRASRRGRLRTKSGRTGAGAGGKNAVGATGGRAAHRRTDGGARGAGGSLAGAGRMRAVAGSSRSHRRRAH